MSPPAAAHWFAFILVSPALAVAQNVTRPAVHPARAQPVAPMLGVRDTMAPIALTGVTVIDVRDGHQLPSQTVVIVGSRIQALGPAASIKVPAGARVVDARSKFLIPGLWDLHVHPMEQQDVVDLLSIANGVTGMRDAGSSVSLATLVRRKEEIATGVRVGPRDVVAGPSIVSCSWKEREEHTICIATPAEARLVVDFLKASGADMLKSYEPPPDLFYALAAEARRVGILLGGHLSQGVTVEEASDSGERIVDHAEGIEGACLDRGSTHPDPAKCAALATRFKRNRTWSLLGPLALVATPTRLTDDAIRARQQYVPSRFRHTEDKVPRAQEQLDLSPLERASLPIVLGSDVPFREGRWGLWGTWILPGFELQDILAIVVEHGLTPLYALQAATMNAAQAVGVGDSLGTVEVGKLADLVLLDADPLADIYNTQKIRAVMANGRYFDRTALDQLLARAGAGGSSRDD